MKSDIGKYRLLREQLEEAKKTIQDIAVDENPTVVKAKLIPIMNRITAYESWFDSMGAKEQEKQVKAKFRDVLKDQEKRKKLEEFAATL